jgi:hypothetical protein
MPGGEITSALAAIGGAVVGGLASFGSTWVRERSQSRRDLLEREMVKRETTYAEFIEQGSKLYVDTAMHNIHDDDEACVQAIVESTVSLYSVASRIRLFASERVIKEAEDVLDLIVNQLDSENLSVEQLHKSGEFKEKDPLKTFSTICRRELREMLKAN